MNQQSERKLVIKYINCPKRDKIWKSFADQIYAIEINKKYKRLKQQTSMILVKLRLPFHHLKHKAPQKSHLLLASVSWWTALEELQLGTRC